MADPTTSTQSANLQYVYNKVTSVLGPAEANVVKELEALKSGAELSQGDLLKLQFNIAKYSITAATLSTLMKEITEGLTQTVSKIS